MRRSIVLFIALSLLVSGCGTLEISFETPPPAIAESPAESGSDASMTVEPGLSLNSSSEEIRRAMLESATNWQSIWMDGTFIGYDPGATEPPPVLREQVWIDLPTSRFRSLKGYVNGSMDALKISDGTTVLDMHLQTGQSQSNPLPDLGPEKQFVPAYQPGYAYPQPLWGQLGTTISLLAFPSDFAQSEGTFRPLGMELVAGHETLVVEWTYATNNLPSWRMWLDTETAVALKMQHFGKDGSENVQSEIVVDQVIYGHIFDDSLFQAPSTPPQFSDVDGNPLTISQPAPTASSDPDPLREVYFFAMDQGPAAGSTQLVRVSGSCAAGLSPCPEAEVVATPVTLNSSLTSLVWSPDGGVAAFAYPVNPDGNRTALFLFDPQAEIWQSLAEFNFIDPPFWSPDGNWLAFRVQDGEGNDEIYAIRRDGSGLTNLSISEKLPSDGSPYALSGWINNHVILHSRSNGTVYLLRVEDGSVTPLFETPLAKSDLVFPSPDGYFLAYTDAEDQRIALNLLTPDGNTVRELAAFRNTSIYPLVWSPDGARLAFAALTDATDPAAGQDILIIGSDGRELHEVYHSPMASIAEIAFSPDGNYLLFQDDDALGRHIFVVDLSTLEQHKLEISNLPMDSWWFAPSWRR
jgi:Tol biopolymer transport system component